MRQDWRGGCFSIQVGGRGLGKNGEDGRGAVQQPLAFEQRLEVKQAEGR